MRHNMTGPNVSCGEKTKITQRVKITIMNQTWSITCTSAFVLGYLFNER